MKMFTIIGIIGIILIIIFSLLGMITTIWFALLLGLLFAWTLANLPYNKEVIYGVILLGIAGGYHFYLQPSLGLPELPHLTKLFLGSFITFRSIFLAFQVVPPLKPFGAFLMLE